MSGEKRSDYNSQKTSKQPVFDDAQKTVSESKPTKTPPPPPPSKRK